MARFALYLGGEWLGAKDPRLYPQSLLLTLAFSAYAAHDVGAAFMDKMAQGAYATIKAPQISPQKKCPEHDVQGIFHFSRGKLPKGKILLFGFRHGRQAIADNE